MIEQAIGSSIRKESHIMSIRPSSVEQVVSPAQVWARLSTDLQLHVVRLLAELAAHFVLSQAEHVRQTRKESADGLISLAEQDPA
jgi:flagellar biosynthesis regulator FlaF